MDFAVPANHRVRIKESKKLTNIWVLPENEKAVEHDNDYDNCNWSAWNGFLTSGRIEMSGRMATIHTTLLLRSARILRKVLEICRDLLSLKFQWNTCPVSWGCRIHWLHLCRGVRTPPNECPRYDTKQSDGDIPKCWSFGECGVPLYCHPSQVHSGPEW